MDMMSAAETSTLTDPLAWPLVALTLAIHVARHLRKRAA
jgi:hypothetical protein